MSKTPIIMIENYTQQFGEKTVLQNIHLHVNKGEILGLVGPSGSGKTTLVKAIAGTGDISHGTVKVWEHTMPSLQAMQRIGYMAQADALYLDLNAIDHLKFFGRLYGLSSNRLKERIEEVLQMVELLPHAHKPIEHYSGGMKRRLSLAIALLHEPELLILDEPTVGLDPVLRLKFWKEFTRLQEQSVTLLITTHVMDEADRCNRLALLRDGMLLSVDTPHQLKEKWKANNIEEVFLRISEVAL